MNNTLNKYWSWRVLLLALLFAVGIASISLGSLLIWERLPGHYPPVMVGEKGPYYSGMYACATLERSYQCTAGQFWGQAIRLVPLGVAYIVMMMVLKYQFQSLALIIVCYCFLLWLRKAYYTPKNINAVLDRLPKWMDFR